MLLQYVRVRRLLDEELAPRRRARGEPRPLVGSPMYPSEALRDLALFFYLMTVLCLLSALVPPQLGAPANPDVTPDRLLPDWYLLWAFGLLKIAPNVSLFGVDLMSGKFLGVMLIFITFAAVLLVPWIDRAISYIGRSYRKYPISFSEGRRPKRPMADPFMAALGAGGLVFAIMASVYSIREIVIDRFSWMPDSRLVTVVIMLPFVVGVSTYALLRAARRTDDYEWQLNECHGCGRCDQVCPVRPVRKEARINLVYLTHSEADDHVWTCLGCDRCSAECPQGIVFSPHTLRMRASGLVDEPQHAPQRCRDVLAWHTRRTAERGVVPMPKAGEGIGKVGYFEPCSNQLALTRVSHPFGDRKRATLALLEAAGAQVYEVPHVCCGHDALWQGDTDTFERLREANVGSIRASGVRTIVTECAECYRTLARDYGLEGVAVLHVSQYLRAGRLDLRAAAPPAGSDGQARALKVAYHDPCRLGRHMGVYEPPRELIRAVPGVELVELEESRERAQCCGVAAMMNCDQASKGLRVRRLEQVKRAGADVLVTTCPKCITHLVCLKDEGGDYPFKVQDLVEFLAERLPHAAMPMPLARPAGEAAGGLDQALEGDEAEGRVGRKGTRLEERRERSEEKAREEKVERKQKRGPEREHRMEGGEAGVGEADVGEADVREAGEEEASVGETIGGGGRKGRRGRKGGGRKGRGKRGARKDAEGGGEAG
jgi:Fe-S oxidoreductase